MGFHIDACPPRAPQAKGKTEAKVPLSRQLVDTEQRYAGLEGLQAETDARVERSAARAICPATGLTVQIVAEGRIVQQYARGTAARVLIDPACYEGEATERVLPPPPLGRMGRRLAGIARQPVEARPLDLYAALLEVAR